MAALWSRRCQVRTLNKRTVDCPIIGKCTEKALKEKAVKEKTVKEKDMKGVRGLSRKFLVLFLFLGTSEH